MKNFKSQKGFTLPELFFVICFLISVGAALGVLYVAIHFITKFW